MNLLKLLLTTSLSLVSLNYIKKTGDIIFVVDANLEGWGEVLIKFV